MDFDFNDRNLQRAIYDSIRSAPKSNGQRSQFSRSNFSSGNVSTGFRANTLAREGIVAATKRCSYPISKDTNSQVKSSSNKYQNKSGNSLDYGDIRQRSWISLDNGWFQLSPEGSGNYRRCGLHTLLESNNSTSYFSVLYTPRSRDISASLLSDMPSFDLEANFKIMKPTNISSSTKVFSVVFGYLSSSDYTSILMDIETNKIRIVETTSGAENRIHYESNGLKLVWNVFSSFTLHIKQSHICLLLDSKLLYDSSIMTPNHSYRCKGLVGITTQVYIYPCTSKWI